MPYTIQEERTVEYDLLIEYDEDFLRLWPNDVPTTTRCVFRAGRYRDSEGVKVIPEDKIGTVVATESGNQPGAGRYAKVYVKFVDALEVFSTR